VIRIERPASWFAKVSPGFGYADAALHGDGLTSLQYREAQGCTHAGDSSNVTAPRRLRLEKRGRYVSIVR